MSSFSRVLVTGANSGLGKHCLTYFAGQGLTRYTDWQEITEQAQQKPYDAIIHAAYNTGKDISSDNLFSYLNDTLLLTQKLLHIPHHKFVFISTVDVYPKNAEVHQEDEKINEQAIESIYGRSKLMCEALVKNMKDNHLILRPTALLGVTAKPNSLMKMLQGKEVTLSLSAQSSFNYVLHEDLSQFIAVALQQDITGTYNIAASANATLEEIKQEFHLAHPIHFGQYTYSTGQIAHQRAIAVLPSLQKNSLENIRYFLQAKRCAA